MELLIKNGTIINADRTEKADIFIKNGKIAFIRANIDVHENVNLINAEGKFLIPGGIDPHVHMHLPVPGGFSSDDFYTGSRAAILGGTTTLLDFVTPHKSQSLIEALHQRKLEAEESITDYSFHVSPVDWHQGIEEEIAQCIEDGISSFKVYLAYLDTIGLNQEVFEKVLKTVGRLGGMVTAHCETGKEIEKKRTEYFNKGFTHPAYHPLSRPSETEANAVKSAIALAGKYNCPIYIVHVSTKESLKYIEQSKNAGQAVFAETCPQYLLLEDSMYQGSFEHTSPYVMSPPLRKKEDNEALWEALNSGLIDTVGTDHCPFTLSQKNQGIDDFRKIPNGAGGVEHRLELLYTCGVLTNKISLNKWVELCSTKPAELLRLKSKGKITVGMDADIVIWDPEPENVISSQTHHQNTDINIYEGFKTRGKADTVIKNARIFVEKGELATDVSNGSFLTR
ncbi:MAG: dihydropyrimidinase [Saprospiraceae bacterium]|nr:dihydropyrimidinase [Saprospiraceae bacterium]